MSSILTSQGVVFATAMAAVSGTVILLAFRHQKFSHASPRPCLSSDGKRLKNKKNKRVHFAEDVVEPRGDGVEFRKRHRNFSTTITTQPSSSESYNSSDFDDKDIRGEKEEEDKITGMPANRVSLYNGMLRDRVGHRLGYSY